MNNPCLAEKFSITFSGVMDVIYSFKKSSKWYKFKVLIVYTIKNLKFKKSLI